MESALQIADRLERAVGVPVAIRVCWSMAEDRDRSAREKARYLEAARVLEGHTAALRALFLRGRY